MGEDDGLVGEGGVIAYEREEREVDGLITQGLGLIIDDIYTVAASYSCSSDL